jgi:hypothetical protein
VDFRNRKSESIACRKALQAIHFILIRESASFLNSALSLDVAGGLEALEQGCQLTIAIRWPSQTRSELRVMRGAFRFRAGLARALA